MALVLLFLVLFLIIPPGVFIAGKFAKDKIKSYLFGRQRSKTSINAQEKEGLNKKINKRLSFTVKDPRKSPVPFKLIFFLIYGLGAAVSIVGGFSENWSLLAVAIFIAYGAVIFSVITANKIVKARETVMKRMLELKASKMKLVNREKGVPNRPENEFKVLEWGEDLVSPIKMHIYLPTDFDILQVDGFMESFNLIFGGAGRWVENDSDEDHKGFDFNAGIASLRVTPKLPPIAIWHERYLNPETIHWSYFPLALGSENGVPVYNEELDRTERVLGFAVNSGQNKLASQKGFLIGQEITSSPQVLIAGGTGGGKALDSNTKILKLKEEENTTQKNEK